MVNENAFDLTVWMGVLASKLGVEADLLAEAFKEVKEKEEK
jgi:hypothetical protein